MKSPILLSLLSALLYGFAGPAMMKAKENGAAMTVVAFIYGLMATVLCWKYSGGSDPLLTSWKSLLFGGVAGVILGLGFWASGRAISLPDCQISVVSVIIAAYPLVSVAIGLLFMGEADKVEVKRVLLGSAMMVAGLYFVSTATKAPH